MSSEKLKTLRAYCHGVKTDFVYLTEENGDVRIAIDEAGSERSILLTTRTMLALRDWLDRALKGRFVENPDYDEVHP